MTMVKLCGLYRPQDIAAVNEAQPDMCGFIVDVPRSHRSIGLARLRELSALVDPRITRVGVFVDADMETIISLAAEGTIDAAQLHGSEDAAYVRELRAATRIGIIQAFLVRSGKDVARAQESPADMVLLDAGQGAGATFDWPLASGIARPFILAGGLEPENVAEAIRTVRPWGVDMSSSLEKDRVKDPGKMRAAVAAVRRTDGQLC